MDTGEKLANDHWNYVRQVITVGQEPEWSEEKQEFFWDIRVTNIVDVIEFHYKAAFIHGYKHGKAEKTDSNKV